MKTKIEMSKETIENIKWFLQKSHELKNAFFWSPPSSASMRRGYETKNSFFYEGDGIKLEISVNCSCKNIYVYKTVEINGEKKTAAALKKYLK